MNQFASPMHSAAIKIRSAFMLGKDVAESVALVADQIFGRHPDLSKNTSVVA